MKKKKYELQKEGKLKKNKKEVKIKIMEKEVEKQGVLSKATHVQLHSFTKATTML